jgi:hypothetical protein
VAALADVLLHALRCLPFRESLVMVECAVSRGDMTLDYLRCRLPGNRNGRARLVLEWVDRSADSMLETLARTYFRQAGIWVEAQVYVDGVGYVDLLLEGCLIVELDGRQHGEWAQVKKDQRRTNRSVIQATQCFAIFMPTWCTSRRPWWWPRSCRSSRASKRAARCHTMHGVADRRRGNPRIAGPWWLNWSPEHAPRDARQPKRHSSKPGGLPPSGRRELRKLPGEGL